VVGVPFGAAPVTGHERMVNSRIVLGLGGRKGENVAFDGVDGEHAWKAWNATTFLLRFAGFSLSSSRFQFFISNIAIKNTTLGIRANKKSGFPPYSLSFLMFRRFAIF
jgi:hypothetical protein